MPENEPLEELPRSLVERLKTADRPVPMITARVDREISTLAHAHFRARRRQPDFRRPAWAAVAATILLAALVAQFRDPRPEPGATYADLDRSGRIDIADVLALARTQEPGERSQAELDAFAYRIVSLKGDDAS